jgi:hypothetical protein
MRRKVFIAAALSLGMLSVCETASGQDSRFNLWRRDSPFGYQDTRGYRGYGHEHHHFHHWHQRTFCDYGDAVRFAQVLRYRGFDIRIQRAGIDWAVLYRH